jgi:hypothetical protein
MNFIIFVLLFTILCGWLDARIAPRPRTSPKEER